MKAIAAIFLSLFIFSNLLWAEAHEKLKVGLVLPLTGKAADYGFAIKNCIDLAQRDRPELFNNITFIYEDAAYEPRLAVSSLNKLNNIYYSSLISSTMILIKK
jgi:ABC-type branched-subunit amino acid transport system substrate-binding protein